MEDFDRDEDFYLRKELLTRIFAKYIKIYGEEQVTKGLYALREKMSAEEEGWGSFDIHAESWAGEGKQFCEMVREMYADLVKLKRQAARGEKEYYAGEKISFANEAVSYILEENYEPHERAEASWRLYKASLQMKGEERAKKKAKDLANGNVHKKPHKKLEELSEENKIEINKRLISYMLECYYEPYEYEEALEKMRKIAQEIDFKKEKRKIARRFQLLAIRNKLLKITIAIIAIGLFSLGFGADKLYKIYFSKTKLFQDGIIKTQETVDLYANEEEADRIQAEIKELRKAGKFKKTFIKEILRDGILWHEYRVRYILSTGEERIKLEWENVGDN